MHYYKRERAIVGGVDGGVLQGSIRMQGSQALGMGIY